MEVMSSPVEEVIVASMPGVREATEESFRGRITKVWAVFAKFVNARVSRMIAYDENNIVKVEKLWEWSFFQRSTLQWMTASLLRRRDTDLWG